MSKSHFDFGGPAARITIDIPGYNPRKQIDRQQKQRQRARQEAQRKDSTPPVRQAQGASPPASHIPRTGQPVPLAQPPVNRAPTQRPVATVSSWNCDYSETDLAELNAALAEPPPLDYETEKALRACFAE